MGFSSTHEAADKKLSFDRLWNSLFTSELLGQIVYVKAEVSISLYDRGLHPSRCVEILRDSMDRRCGWWWRQGASMAKRLRAKPTVQSRGGA